MIFKVVSNSWEIDSLPLVSYLIENDWDDFGYATTFYLIVVDLEGVRNKIGQIKIGSFNMFKPTNRRPNILNVFEELDESFFSLGQDPSYYESINRLENGLGLQVLVKLRDVVEDIDLFDRAIKEQVTKDSLLRDVSEITVRGQFRRILLGESKFSHYDFLYKLYNAHDETNSVELLFNVVPKSSPPTNIHVVIGRNGVGKTRLLQGMTRALLDRINLEQFGEFIHKDNAVINTEVFANLVSVTFSAFDPFDPLPDRKGSDIVGIKYSYVGLKYFSDDNYQEVWLKNSNMLSNEFVNSFNNCINSDRILRWKEAVKVLQTDPVFQEAGIIELIDTDKLQQYAFSLFERLSSGHKIVLLTITRLIETVEERTLILLDEPESHLHPPLLSAFIRALSNLLMDRNGVAIIATHSPVILQEVPSSCVWKIRRKGFSTAVERPEIETFGENVGVLTRDVFGLEVTKSGFHQLLQNAIDEKGDFDSVIKYFGDNLGAEARAIVRTLTLKWNNNNR